MSRRERTLRKLVAWGVSVLYRTLEVRHKPGATAEGPQIVNASHFAGFADPILLSRALDRLPRFIARDVIWKFPVVGRILSFAGAIPVHKSDDGGPTSNDEMFRSTYDALGDGDLITIFPEGITVDDPHIAHVKTGSARIALGARAAGVSGISILSAGLHYANKAALRSNVFIDVGYPLDLDAWVEENIPSGHAQDASNRDAVRALADEMERRLRWAAPDFEDWHTAHSLAAAADIALRPRISAGLHPEDSDVGHGDTEVLARLIDAADPEAKAEVGSAVERYQRELDAFGYDDGMLVQGINGRRSFVVSIVRSVLLGVLLVPFAFIGLAVNAVPLLLMWLIGRRNVADAMMATIKPLAAVCVFGTTWAVWGYLVWNGYGAGLLAAWIVLLPFYLFALIALAERLAVLGRVVSMLRNVRSIGDVYDQMMTDRTAVVEAVAQAL